MKRFGVLGAVAFALLVQASPAAARGTFLFGWGSSNTTSADYLTLDRPSVLRFDVAIENDGAARCVTTLRTLPADNQRTFIVRPHSDYHVRTWMHLTAGDDRIIVQSTCTWTMSVFVTSA